MQGDGRTPVGLVAGIDGIAVGPLGFPSEGLVSAVGTALHRHLVADHEGGVESHAELADDVDVAAVFVLAHVLPEGPGTAAGNDAQVVFQFFLRHADPVVPDDQQAGLLVER